MYFVIKKDDDNLNIIFPSEGIKSMQALGLQMKIDYFLKLMAEGYPFYFDSESIREIKELEPFEPRKYYRFGLINELYDSPIITVKFKDAKRSDLNE